MADTLYCDWGDHGGQCYEFWKCEPCCGEPCNFMDGLYCCLCWWCCGCFAFAKHLASGNDQPCACIDHCLVPWCSCCWLGCIGIFIFNTITRANLRIKNGIGEPQCQAGDCIMTIPTAICGGYGCFCEFCQELRAEPKEDWDWLKQITGGDPGFVCMSDCAYCRHAK